MIKVRKADGTIVEVADDYAVQEGETIVTDENTDKGIDEATLKSLLEKSAQDVVKKFLETASTELTEKFMSGVTEMRKKAIDTGKVEAKRNVTNEFLKAIWNGDNV